MDKAQQDAMKKEAGIEAAKLVKSGMIVGLGTGSTVRFLVDELGRRKQEEGLEFTGVTTSRRTQEQAEGYGIKIVNIDDVDHIDLCIDGADEVDKNFNGIKGGGAALLWEKIVAINSNRIVWIVDASKLVDVIGKFPLPVEVIPFGAMHVIERMKERGYNPTLRLDAEGKPCAPTRTTTSSTCISSASTTRQVSTRISSTWWASSKTACSSTWSTRSSWAIRTARARSSIRTRREHSQDIPVCSGQRPRAGSARSFCYREPNAPCRIRPHI